MRRPRRPRSDRSRDLWSDVYYQAAEKPAENVIGKAFKYSLRLKKEQDFNSRHFCANIVPAVQLLHCENGCLSLKSIDSPF